MSNGASVIMKDNDIIRRQTWKYEVKMKDITIKTLSLLICLCMLVSPVTVFADAFGGEFCDIMIYASEEHFAKLDDARAALEHLCGDNIEIFAEYENALFGFWAKVPEYYVDVIDKLDHFDAHVCGSYSALEYTDTEYETSAAYASEMLGANEIHEIGYTGKGTVVAVIDDGFDLTHEVYEKMPDSPTLTRDDIMGLFDSNELNASKLATNTDGIYVSEKIPFAFDYSSASSDVAAFDSHGTHVSAIIGGNGERITGVAPDCQLLLMKVFSGASNASEQFVALALEDAVTLGADVINMSLGTYTGSVETSKDSAINRMAKRLTNAGIVVVCAAGNESSSADTSTFATSVGLSYPLAEMPDYGTISHPAVIEDFIAVASAGNTYVLRDELIYTGDGKTYRMEYTDTNSKFGIIDASFISYFAERELEYVRVPGVGAPSDYNGNGLDLTGKIALVKRGEIAFGEKVNAACAAGAVAVIVYDDTDGEAVSMDLDGCTIPAVFISKKDGEYLSRQREKKISFKSSLYEFEKNPNAYKMSDFSSWGTTPSMTLKPDVTSVGESVFSAAQGGGYTSLSGTSMATPFVSGFAALICEKLDRDESKYILSRRTRYIKNVIMNTAIPLKMPGTDIEYSPRKQGAGLVDLVRAASADFLLTGLDLQSVVYLERDDDGRYALEFLIENLGDEKLDLEIDVSVLCDTFKDIELDVNGETVSYEFNALTSERLLNADVIPSDDSGFEKSENSGKYKISIDAGATCSALIYITLDDEEMKKHESLENGYFVEGFLYARSGDSECSVPFIGFSSDFSSANMLDATVYDGDNTVPFYTGNAIVSKDENGKIRVLGSSDGTLSGAKEMYIAFSPNADGKADEIYLLPSLLRNISAYKVEIEDKNGEIVCSKREDTPITKGGAERNDPIYLWNGEDGIFDGYVFPDGEYTVKFTVISDDGMAAQTLTLKVKLDTALPRLISTSVKDEGDRRMLYVKTYDLSGVKSVTLYDSSDVKNRGGAVKGTLCEDGLFMFDITEQKSGILWIDIEDYAMNVKTSKIGV